MPDSMTPLLISGAAGTKYNLAILGDGFTGAEQGIYNDKVQKLLMDGVFGYDCFYEDKQGFNIYRINLISHDSGVKQIKYDPSNNYSTISSTFRDTALGYIYNGLWERCWIEEDVNTTTLLQNALDTWVPDYDFILVILNESAWGGCGGNRWQVVTLAGDWTLPAHEFGHGIGDLADEYCKLQGHSGGEPTQVNVTTNTNLATLKWKSFIAPATPVPTGIASATATDCAVYNQGTRPTLWVDHQDVGLFEGGNTYKFGIYRPVINCRMRDNSPPFCPICYTQMKRTLDVKTGRTFLKCYAGDFNGNGKDDLLVHNDNSITIYRSNGSQLDLVFNAVNRVPGSWKFKPNDQFYIGDFNGDGKDEVAVYNGLDWARPCLGLLVNDGNDGLKLIARYDGFIRGWHFQKADQFYVADFNGDGMKDLYLFNGKDGPFPYIGMLASTGSGFQLVRRYNSNMPRWQMGPNDQHFVGDFDGNGKVDLFVFNGVDWSIPYFGIFKSTGTDLRMLHRFNGIMPKWTMGQHDQYFIGDFDGDGRADLFVFNGSDWAFACLGMLKSTGSGLSSVKRYNGNIPGWQMHKNDSYYVADLNGDGKADIFVYNSNDWSHKYLGMIISDGATLNAYKEKDSVGEWSLGTVDQIVPCNYEGTAGKRDLFVHNQDRFGMMHVSSKTISLQKVYHRWIHNYRYGKHW